MNMSWGQLSTDIWWTEPLPHLDDPICDEKQLCWFHGRLGQILLCRTFLFVSICRSCCHLSSSSYIVHVELWYPNLRHRFQFSGASEPPSVFHSVCSGVFEAHRTLEMRNISGYSLNRQCRIKSLSTCRLSWDRSTAVFSQSCRDRTTVWAISSWCIVSEDTACIFLAYPKNTAKYFLTHDWRSGTPRIHSPVECDGLRLYTAVIFHSQANFDK